MDNLKFRAWNIRTEKYNYYVEISSYLDGSLSVSAGETNNNAIGNTDNFIVEQFTGLKDKNGMDIYVGDILSTGHLGFVCPVTFEDGCFQLRTNRDQGNSHLPQARADRLVICGNIHQNKELIYS